MDYIHADPRNIPPALLAGYTGRKVKIQITESVTIDFDAGQWHGGSKSDYWTVQIATGRTLAAKADTKIKLEPGFAVVRHSIFCGKDMGVTIYALAADIAPMLPKAAPALTQDQLIVLAVAQSCKPAYRRDEAARHGVAARDYDAVRESLVALGLFNSQGALTLEGKNTPTPRV